MTFFYGHEAAILLGLGWLFSAACSSMPDLPDNAGYFARWSHNFVQALAANINKIKQKQPPV